MSIQLQIDFLKDWIEILKQWLQGRGYSVSSIPDDKIPLIYAKISQRLITPAPRQIHKSKGFLCPSQLQHGLTILEASVIKGEDINSHLSRSMNDILYNDLLLNDWGIFHFHLGKGVERDGYVERTGPLLFAKVTNSDFYEINIYTHGNWTNLDLVEIIHNNWPDTIEIFKVKGIKDISYTPTSDNIRDLRNANLNSFIKTKDGTIYMPIGGGFMLDGTSMNARIGTDKNIRFVQSLEKWVKDNIKSLLNDLKKAGCSEDKPLKIKLDIDSSHYYASCSDYNLRFILKKRSHILHYYLF